MKMKMRGGKWSQFTHTLMYGTQEWQGAPGLLGSLLTAHSHLERLMHKSVVKGEDDPIDEVCCDKSLNFFFFFFFPSV